MALLAQADFEQNSSIQKPSRCPGDVDDGSPCMATKFRDTVTENGMHATSGRLCRACPALIMTHGAARRGAAGGTPVYCSDYQEIKIQEQVQRLAIGTIPRSLDVVLEHDLVDACKPGDDVTITYVCRSMQFVVKGLTVDHIGVS